MEYWWAIKVNPVGPWKDPIVEQQAAAIMRTQDEFTNSKQGEIKTATGE